MTKRHEILNDKELWLQLEFKASGWLATCDDHYLRGFWIDGFRPDLARNTKCGLEVEGAAWVMGRGTGEYQFIAVLPQKLLHRRNPAFVIDRLSLDEGHRTLRIELAKLKATAEPGAAPNCGPGAPAKHPGAVEGPQSVT